MKLVWVKCDKCDKFTLTPYSMYEYVLCPEHYFKIKKKVKEYIEV